MRARVARLAVRPDPGAKDGLLVVGVTHPDVLLPGMVYEIIDQTGLGEDYMVIRKVGPSSYSGPRTEPPLSPWGRSVSQIVMDGDHLLTADEVRLREYLDASDWEVRVATDD